MTPSRLICSATMSLRILFSRFVLVKILAQGMPTITATDQLHSLTSSRTRLCEIDSGMAGCRLTPALSHRRGAKRRGYWKRYACSRRLERWLGIFVLHLRSTELPRQPSYRETHPGEKSPEPGETSAAGDRFRVCVICRRSESVDGQPQAYARKHHRRERGELDGNLHGRDPTIAKMPNVRVGRRRGAKRRGYRKRRLRRSGSTAD